MKGGSIKELLDCHDPGLAGHCRYDHMDLLFHIFRSLQLSGYQGVPIHNITRDEVQDFTQAELLVDLRCALQVCCVLIAVFPPFADNLPAHASYCVTRMTAMTYLARPLLHLLLSRSA